MPNPVDIDRLQSTLRDAVVVDLSVYRATRGAPDGSKSAPAEIRPGFSFVWIAVAILFLLFILRAA